MMTKRNNLVDLPEDLLVEILSRVPIVSLVQLRSTSKALNAFIKDERLAKKHSTDAPKQSLIIMLIASRVYLLSIDLHRIHNNKVKLNRTSQFSLKDPLSSSSKEVDIRNIFHCDGLLLCTIIHIRMVVWNPCSSESKWIQPRKSYKKYDIYALGKSSCNKYKILRIYCSTCRGVTHEYEIYDFTSNSWRVVGMTSAWFILRSWARGISVNGNTYWLASAREFFVGHILLYFNFSTERFASVCLPGDHLSYQVIALSVTMEDQKLCLLATQGWQQLHEIDVWIATKIESTGASWSKFLSVGLAHIKQPFCFSTGMNFLFDQENKVLVCRGEKRISNTFLHVVGEDKCIQVDHLYAESKCSLVVNYVPTLSQIQQGLEFLE